jgi:hypothetical protein
MKLTHIGISNFRSIGEEFVTLDLTKKINVLVGANNCGKSSVLWSLLHLKGSIRSDYLDSDYHRLDKQRQPVFRARGEIDLKSGSSMPLVVDFIPHAQTIRATATSWDSLTHGNFENIWRNFSGQSFGRSLNSDELADYKLTRGTEIARPAIKSLPPAILVPQFREISGGDKYELRGSGIISRLASWDRPDFGKRGDRKKSSKFVICCGS